MDKIIPSCLYDFVKDNLKNVIERRIIMEWDILQLK